MKETKSRIRPDSEPPKRALKIEEDGDFCKGTVKPNIRLMGRWLERAGFRSGKRVSVTCVAPGIIELRSPDAIPIVNGPTQCSLEQPELALFIGLPQEPF